jgi:hypothetical protein
MALAQVVYHISRDADFATRMRSDPESTLAAKGWRLTKEELAFLMTVLKRETFDKVDVEHLAKAVATPWRF